METKTDAIEMTEEDWGRVFVDHDNSCPQVAWRGGSDRGPCNCPAELVWRKLRAAVYTGEFAAGMIADLQRQLHGGSDAS
jgi:hypothetical protein